MTAPLIPPVGDAKTVTSSEGPNGGCGGFQMTGELHVKDLHARIVHAIVTSRTATPISLQSSIL